jgi:hypothetical protein
MWRRRALDPLRREPIVALVAAALAAGWWCLQAEASPPPPDWRRALPLLIVALPFLLRLVRIDRRGRVVAGTALAFVMLAVLSLSFGAYDHSAGVAKVWMLIGALGIAMAIAGQPSPSHLIAALALVGGGAAALSLDPTTGCHRPRNFPSRPRAPIALFQV